MEYCVRYSITVEIDGGSTTKRGVHCWTEYYHLEENIPSIDYIEPPIEGGEGSAWINNRGGWSGNNPPQTRPRSDDEKKENLNSIYGTESNLDNDQKRDLTEALDKFNESPYFHNVFMTLQSQGSKLQFIIDPALKPDTPACYKPASQSIAFRTSLDIKSEFLKEELLHAQQHKIYGTKFRTKLKNFEFEAKVFRDITHQKDDGLAMIVGSAGGSEEFCKEYDRWIIELGEKKSINFLDHTQKFYTLLKKWTAYQGESDENLPPYLLIQFIK